MQQREVGRGPFTKSRLDGQNEWKIRYKLKRDDEEGEDTV